MNAYRLALGSALLAVAGCNAHAIDAHVDSELDDAHARADGAIRFVRCADGSSFGLDCGLVVRITETADFRARFRAKECVGKSDEACAAAMGRLVDFEFARRYYAADYDAVARECASKPGSCEAPEAYELALLHSHNARVQATYTEEADRLEDERAAAHAEEEAKTRAAVGAVLGALAAASGGSSCESYPNAFGGVATVCSR